MLVDSRKSRDFWFVLQARYRHIWPKGTVLCKDKDTEPVLGNAGLLQNPAPWLIVYWVALGGGGGRGGKGKKKKSRQLHAMGLLTLLVQIPYGGTWRHLFPRRCCPLSVSGRLPALLVRQRSAPAPGAQSRGAAGGGGAGPPAGHPAAPCPSPTETVATSPRAPLGREPVCAVLRSGETVETFSGSCRVGCGEGRRAGWQLPGPARTPGPRPRAASSAQSSASLPLSSRDEER